MIAVNTVRCHSWIMLKIKLISVPEINIFYVLLNFLVGRRESECDDDAALTEEILIQHTEKNINWKSDIFFFSTQKILLLKKKEKKENSFGQKWKKKKFLLIIFFTGKKKSPEKNVFTEHIHFFYFRIFFFTMFDTWKIMYLYIIYILCSCENSFFHPLHTWKKSWFLLFHCFMEKINSLGPKHEQKSWFFFHTLLLFIYFLKSQKKKIVTRQVNFFLFRIFFYCPHLKKNFSWKKNHLSVLLETNLCSCENFFFSLGPTH